MADKQESALTQQSDCKWVRALDANGNSIRISKEDLAAVVGELLQKNYLYPFQRRSVPESDLNRFVNPGWGMIAGDSFKNIPNGAYKFGTVFLIGSPTRFDHVAQFYVPDNNTGFYFRSVYSGAESDLTEINTEWKKISFSNIM